MSTQMQSTTPGKQTPAKAKHGSQRVSCPHSVGPEWGRPSLAQHKWAHYTWGTKQGVQHLTNSVPVQRTLPAAWCTSERRDCRSAGPTRSEKWLLHMHVLLRHMHVITDDVQHHLLWPDCCTQCTHTPRAPHCIKIYCPTRGGCPILLHPPRRQCAVVHRADAHKRTFAKHTTGC
jgi:hypothetical protein